MLYDPNITRTNMHFNNYLSGGLNLLFAVQSPQRVESSPNYFSLSRTVLYQSYAFLERSTFQFGIGSIYLY